MNDKLKLDTLLEDGLQSELMLQLHLKALRETLKQQLQETERIQTEELEKRIQQNAHLSADSSKNTSGNKKNPTEYVTSYYLFFLAFVHLKLTYFKELYCFTG